MSQQHPSVLAIIPARGGSKGIPRKNVRLVAGKPLIAWNLDECAKSRHLTRVVVSTDDAEIARVSREHGAEVVWRPAEISGDVATAEDALLHTLAHLRSAEGYEPDFVAYMQCTSPLTTAEDIDGAIETALREQADTVIPVADFHYFLWKSTGDTSVGVNHDLRFRPRRQDREPQYIETGAVYILRTRGFIEARHRFFGKIMMWHMPLERVQEIDEPADLLRCEIMLRERLYADRESLVPDAVAAVVFDFDGVFTDNRVLVSQTGDEAVLCNRSDGLGLAELRGLGVALAVFSTEVNPVVAVRCRKLQLECVHGLADKRAALVSWLSERGIDPKMVVYVGNDANDLGCMTLVGCAVAPADAHPLAKDAAKIVLRQNGGAGAVREICDILSKRLRGSS